MNLSCGIEQIFGVTFYVCLLFLVARNLTLKLNAGIVLKVFERIRWADLSTDMEPSCLSICILC